MRFTIVGFSMLALTSVAHAETVTSCQTQANQAVAEWADGVLKPTASSVGARPTDAILVISAGRMFSYSPKTGTDVRLSQQLGHKVRDYNIVWRAEYDRCIGGERGLVILRY
jgi:hypothetical protein